jgi:antitoxin YefM
MVGLGVFMTTIQLEQTNQTVSSVLSQVRDADAALLVNSLGEEFVLMSKKEWDSWQETLYLMSNPVNAARVLKGIRQIEAGQTVKKNLVDL